MAAIASVPKERSGLASAINNTSRQAAGAVGIAVAGAIAGQPTDAGSFVSGFHLVVAGAVSLYVLTAIVGLAVVPGALLADGSRRRQAAACGSGSGSGSGSGVSGTSGPSAPDAISSCQL